ISDGESQVVYLNSFFSPAFTIQTLMLRRLGLIPRIPFIVAPRGEFSPNALRLKRIKKLAYLHAAKRLGFYEDVLWQASSALEEEQVRSWFGSCVPIALAPNMSELIAFSNDRSRVPKTAGKLTVVFLSRISRKKNLDFGLELLSKLTGQI